MRYHFKIHRQDKGYWAECLEMEGCVTQGKDRRELEAMMKDVLGAYLDEPEDSRQVFPQPDPTLKGRGIVAVQVDPKIAAAMQIRQLRLASGKTQKEIALALGMKSVWNYQRLESSRHTNLELATMAKLKSIFPDFSVDHVLA